MKVICSSICGSLKRLNKRKIALPSLSLIVALLAALGCSDTGIEIPDPYLEAAMRQHLKIKRGSLSRENLARLTVFDVDHGNVTNLEGIQECKSLNTLLLGKSVLSEGKVNTYVNNVTDISPLAALTGLEKWSWITTLFPILLL